jgi:uncharacterized protein
MPNANRYFSYSTRGLPKGCQLCVQGRKLVLFVTGICKRACFYCSISDEKHKSDVGFANERPVQSVKDIILEARANAAFGAGLTGGDPLCRPQRTLEYIKALKAEFGKGFHIHLYTTPESLTKSGLERLFKAGLDELRVHPDLEDKRAWNNLALPAEFNWDYGLEIPVIPTLTDNTLSLIKQTQGLIKFLNLNELEIADNSYNSLNKLGFFTKACESYAIQGSLEAGLCILKHCEQFSFKTHLCTAKLKDAVQLSNRIKLRAKTVACTFDKVTKEGTLLRGAVYLPGLEPGADYKLRLAEVNKPPIIDQLMQLQSAIGLQDTVLDWRFLRLLGAQKHIKKKRKLIRSLGAIPALLEEYPTWDAMLIEVEFL